MSDFNPDIWRLQAQFNTEGLIAALSDSDPGIRKRAAAALRALGAFQTIPKLEETLEKETDPEVRSNILSALATLRREKEHRTTEKQTAVPAEPTEAERLIAELKAAKEPDEIIRVANELGHLGDKQAVEPLVILFNNTRTPIKVRLAVAEVLLQLESAPVEVALLGALRSPEWRVRRNGVAILGQLRAEWAVEPLQKALKDDNEVVRKTAYAALRNIGTPEAREALDTLRPAKARKDEGPLPKATSPTLPKNTGSASGTETISTESMPGEPFQTARTNDDKQSIAWPKRKKKAAGQALLPTKPLNPKTLDSSKHYLDHLNQADDRKKTDDDS